MGDKTTERRKGSKKVFGSGLARVFTNSILSTITYKFSDTLELETKIFFNMDSHLSYVIKPEIRYDINDAFKMTFGIDFVDGVEDTFFGQFDNDDRSYLFLRYSF